MKTSIMSLKSNDLSVILSVTLSPVIFWTPGRIGNKVRGTEISFPGSNLSKLTPEIPNPIIPDMVLLWLKNNCGWIAWSERLRISHLTLKGVSRRIREGMSLILTSTSAAFATFFGAKNGSNLRCEKYPNVVTFLSSGAVWSLPISPNFDFQIISIFPIVVAVFIYDSKSAQKIFTAG